MHFKLTSLRFWLFLSAMFVFAQTASIAHAAQYGEQTHKHDGIVCEMGSIAVNDQVILPPSVTIFEIIAPVPNYTILAVDVWSWSWPPGRAPPPRGPPSINQ